MKELRKLIWILVLIITNLSTIGYSECYAQKVSIDDKDYFLIITSYAHDSRLVSEVTEDLDFVLKHVGIEMDQKIESMGILGLGNCNEWRYIMKSIVEKHRNPHLKGIILIGQEAWGTYLSFNDQLPGIPFYGTKISQNGIYIPSHIDSLEIWNPEPIDTKQLGRLKGARGGNFNNFNIEENVKLALALYPSLQNIAFVSDNTYGGVSLQAQFKKVMKTKFQQLNPILLDGRTSSVSEIQQKIDMLPENSAIILGTWRVSNKGTFFVDKIIKEMLASRPEIPTFTSTGHGLPNTVIGGYIPQYNTHNTDYLEEIISDMQDGVYEEHFIDNPNEFVINHEKFNKLKLDKTKIPQGARYVDESNVKIEKYRNLMLVATLSTIAAVAVLIILVILLRKMKVQNKRLNEQTEELRIAKENAEKSDKLKSAFLANISHEIRTPMNAIMGFTSLLHEVDQSTLKEYQHYILENGNTLLELLTQTVEYSKVDSGIVEFDMSKFNMARIFNELKLTYEHKMPQGITLSTIIPYNDCLITYDSDKISKIMIVLLDNAIKFIRHGSIEMGFFRKEKSIIMYVSDTGIGIAEDNQKKIFDKFEKLDSFSQGAGLGLALIKAITEKSGGSVKVVSKPDVGSRFIVEIPCEISSPTDHWKEFDISEEIYDVNTLLKGELNNSLKILVAEDSSYNYTLLESIMKNHQLVHVANGKEAVLAMQKDWYDLVLMDIKMPVMDGLTATSEIRKFDKSTPIIAVTAFTFDNNFKSAISAGCNDFLEKPFTRSKIYSSILKLMQNQQ